MSQFAELYNTPQWRHLRKGQLEKQPLCELCLKFDKITPAEVAHHKIPHKGDRELFFDPDNLESSCKTCHDSHQQRQEKSGHLPGCDVNGIPIDPRHSWNK